MFTLPFAFYCSSLRTRAEVEGKVGGFVPRAGETKKVQTTRGRAQTQNSSPFSGHLSLGGKATQPFAFRALSDIRDGIRAEAAERKRFVTSP